MDAVFVSPTVSLFRSFVSLVRSVEVCIPNSSLSAVFAIAKFVLARIVVQLLSMFVYAVSAESSVLYFVVSAELSAFTLPVSALASVFAFAVVVESYTLLSVAFALSIAFSIAVFAERIELWYATNALLMPILVFRLNVCNWYAVSPSMNSAKVGISQSKQYLNQSEFDIPSDSVLPRKSAHV